MTPSTDPTRPLRARAASLAGVTEGTSCNQSSFKVGKKSFFFIGPGAKGVGFKAMFKLSSSLEKARELAEKDPERYQAASTGWVTVRFTEQKPLARSTWEKWLKEAHAIAAGEK